MGGLSGHTGVARQQITERVWYPLLGSCSGEEHHVDTKSVALSRNPKRCQDFPRSKTVPSAPTTPAAPAGRPPRRPGMDCRSEFHKVMGSRVGEAAFMGSWSMPRSTLGASTHSIPLNHLNHHVQETPSPHVHRCRN